MSREILAAPVLGAGELSLLAVHRHVPQRGLPDLLAAAMRVGDPVCRALFHVQACRDCARVDEAELCARGTELVAACAGWRPRGRRPEA